MRINLSRLSENLPEQQTYLQGYTPGLFRAIEHAHYETDSAQVDWNGFTLQEAQQALDMAMNYCDGESIDEEARDPDGPSNEGNAIHEFILNRELIYSLKQVRPEKAAEEGDFF